MLKGLRSFWNLFTKKDFAITTKGLIVKLEDTTNPEVVVVSFGSFNGSGQWVAKKTITLFGTDISERITCIKAGELLKQKIKK